MPRHTRSVGRVSCTIGRGLGTGGRNMFVRPISRFRFLWFGFGVWCLDVYVGPCCSTSATSCRKEIRPARTPPKGTSICCGAPCFCTWWDYRREYSHAVLVRCAFFSFLWCCNAINLSAYNAVRSFLRRDNLVFCCRNLTAFKEHI